MLADGLLHLTEFAGATKQFIGSGFVVLRPTDHRQVI